MAKNPVPAPRTPEEPTPTGGAASAPIGTAAPGGAGGAGGTVPTPDDPQGKHAAPFDDEQRVMHSGLVMRDDISATQVSGAATRDVSASHVSRLLYRAIESAGGPVYESQHIERQLRGNRA